MVASRRVADAIIRASLMLISVKREASTQRRQTNCASVLARVRACRAYRSRTSSLPTYASAQIASRSCAFLLLSFQPIDVRTREINPLYTRIHVVDYTRDIHRRGATLMFPKAFGLRATRYRHLTISNTNSRNSETIIPLPLIILQEPSARVHAEHAVLSDQFVNHSWNCIANYFISCVT